MKVNEVNKETLNLIMSEPDKGGAKAAQETRRDGQQKHEGHEAGETPPRGIVTSKLVLIL